MRWFSRLGSWLRAGHDVQSLEERTAPIAFAHDPRHLPAATPEQFRRRLIESVDRCLSAGRAELSVLDPAVQVLAIPPSRRERPIDEESLAADIDRAVSSLQSDGRTLASLTWSALRDARPRFEPTYLELSADAPERFDGSVGLVFFVDTDAVAQAMAMAAQGLGLSTRLSDDGDVVIVRDGRFSARVGVNALLAESLWTARGPLAVVQRRARMLPAEFRGFQALLGGLKRRFPGCAVDLDGDAIRIRDGEAEHTVDYRHLSAAMRASRMSADAWLSRCGLLDLVRQEGDPILLVRSPAFLKAWPDALAREEDGHCIVIARQTAEGWTRPILRRPDDPPERFAHFHEEAERQLGFGRYSAHAFIEESETHFAISLVGDRVASIALAPALIRGILEQLMPPPARVLLIGHGEDRLIIADELCPPALIDDVLRRTERLERDLMEDPGDRLSYRATIELPPHAAGAFELTLIDTAYFDIMEQVEGDARLEVGRREYLRGLALQAVGRMDLAVEALKKAVRHDRDDGDLNLVLGQTLFGEGEHADALPFLEVAARALPQSAEAANALGLARGVAGQLAEASAAFEAAVRLEPGEPSFLVNLGRSYLDAHLFPKARVCLERALRLEPGLAQAHASMAVLCQRTGDLPGARRHARQALAEEPDDETVNALLAFLDDD